MSLYQCEVCGGRENTACGHYWDRKRISAYNWSGIESRKGKALCSACGPTQYADGKLTEFKGWHGQWPQLFLPLGEFKTNSDGNLEHKKTGDTDLEAYRLTDSQEVCDNISKSDKTTCHELYNCCDCGGTDCGCQYCFSCKACHVCQNE